jgi:predicted NBD/HSP70 family sugar kinase
LNTGWRKAIGIELSPEHITGVLADLKGNVLVRERALLSTERTREEFETSLGTIAARLFGACEEAECLGIGIASFGSFSGSDKILENVAAYPALETFDIAGFVENACGITPTITDAASARALYEIWFNNVGSQGSFLLFDVGAGIGCVTAIDGKLVFGKYDCTGEFGHTVYQPDGAPCGCGRKGCLETLCSTDVIERRTRESVPDRSVMFSNLAREYVEGNREFADIIDDCGRWLGIAVANQINALAPDEVVLTGEMFQLGERFFEKLKQTVNAYVFPAFMKDVIIRRPEAWDESAALGAASLLVRSVFEDIRHIR